MLSVKLATAVETAQILHLLRNAYQPNITAPWRPIAHDLTRDTSSAAVRSRGRFRLSRFLPPFGLIGSALTHEGVADDDGAIKLFQGGHAIALLVKKGCFTLEVVRGISRYADFSGVDTECFFKQNACIGVGLARLGHIANLGRRCRQISVRGSKVRSEVCIFRVGAVERIQYPHIVFINYDS